MGALLSPPTWASSPEYHKIFTFPEGLGMTVLSMASAKHTHPEGHQPLSGGKRGQGPIFLGRQVCEARSLGYPVADFNWLQSQYEAFAFHCLPLLPPHVQRQREQAGAERCEGMSSFRVRRRRQPLPEPAFRHARSGPPLEADIDKPGAFTSVFLQGPPQCLLYTQGGVMI